MRIHTQNARVLVTGAAQGIGLAIAKLFAKNGAKVHICDIDKERLARCQAQNPHFGATAADVSSPEQVATLFEEVQAHLGGLDILVNNAGLSGPTGPVENIGIEEWRRTVAVNLDSAFLCTRAAVPLLKANPGGCIVNISSTAGLFGYPLRTPYAAAKWALIGLTKSLAMELGQFSIRVNAVCPGSINYARMGEVIAREAAATGAAAEQIRKGYAQQVSLQTFIDEEEIASMVLFICSDAGKKISGQALCVDGHTETLRTQQSNH